MRLFAVLLLLAVCATTNDVDVGAAEYPTRTWTNDEGQTLEASLKRLSGATAILDRDGEIIRAPISRLSNADKEWIKLVREIKRWREWTMADGSTRRAKLESVDGDRLEFKDRSETFELTLGDLGDADHGRVAAIYDTPNRGATRFSGSSEGLAYGISVGKVADPLAAGREGVSAISQNWRVANPISREWTDVDGKTIDAEFHGVEDKNLLLTFKDREWKVPLWRFSDDDQQFVSDLRRQQIGADDQLVAATAAQHEPNGRSSINSGLDAVRGRMNPGLNQAYSNRRPASHHEIHNRTQDQKERAQRDAEQRIAEDRRRHEEPMAKMERDRQERERLAAAASPPDDFAQPEPPSFTPGQPTYPTSAANDPGGGTWLNEYQCFSCNHTWTSAREYGAGDKCPSCGTTFDVMEDENGYIVDETATSRARRWGGIVKLGVLVLLAVGGFLGKMARG